MDRILLTLLFGAIGGYIGSKTSLPSGTLLGAMLAVGIANLSGFQGKLPPNISFITQVVIGCIIGLNINQKNVKALSELIMPSVIIVAGLIFMSIVLGILLYKFTGIDYITALFSTSPGGLSSIILITESYGAETHIVMLFHTLRLITVVTLMPIIIKWTYNIAEILKL